MPACRVCHKKLYWPNPYRKGSKPVEKDGTDHSCSRQNLFYCKYCPIHKVGGSAKAIEWHTKQYHANGERFSYEYWSYRFLNMYHRKGKKETVIKEKHINSSRIV